METDKQTFEIRSAPKILHYNDPLVIGAGSLVLGFAIGSGRLKWLSQHTGRIAGSLGTMALNAFFQSLRQRNPDLFRSKARVTH